MPPAQQAFSCVNVCRSWSGTAGLLQPAGSGRLPRFPGLSRDSRERRGQKLLFPALAESMKVLCARASSTYRGLAWGLAAAPGTLSLALFHFPVPECSIKECTYPRNNGQLRLGWIRTDSTARLSVPGPPGAVGGGALPRRPRCGRGGFLRSSARHAGTVNTLGLKSSL